MSRKEGVEGCSGGLFLEEGLGHILVASVVPEQVAETAGLALACVHRHLARTREAPGLGAARRLDQIADSGHLLAGDLRPWIPCPSCPLP